MYHWYIDWLNVYYSDMSVYYIYKYIHTNTNAIKCISWFRSILLLLVVNTYWQKWNRYIMYEILIAVTERRCAITDAYIHILLYLLPDLFYYYSKWRSVRIRKIRLLIQTISIAICFHHSTIENEKNVLWAHNLYGRVWWRTTLH